ncbi:MAG: response regulator [Magnetococcales bacterium]|nr:response regulator [Magnetococcales bacterium]
MASTEIKRPKILTIDDEPGIRETFRDFLEDLDYEVFEGENGRHGLEIFSEVKPDLVLLDLRMPELDGMEVLTILKEKSPDTPVIIVSGTGVIGDAIQAINLGAWDYLLKPVVDMGILRHSVEKVLDRAKLLLQNRAYQENLETQVNIRTEDLHKANAEINELNKELEDRVAQRTMELTAANKELESFAYTVSHDLRAPLRAINNFSQIILEEYSDKIDSEGKTYLSYLVEGSNEMNALIDGLLMLSRSTRGEINKQKVNISNLVTEIIKANKILEPERDVIYDVMPNISAMCDPHLIKTLLENLIGNAWKYTRTTVNSHIKFGETKSSRGTTYFIKDNGAGFDMEYANKLYQPFQRLHKVSEFDGTGIGLATVQRIIHRHGGNIWAEAEVGKGATFYFTLSKNK